MIERIEYCVAVPFMDDYIFLTEGSGSSVTRAFYSTYEEASEKADNWNGKVVQVTFEEID